MDDLMDYLELVTVAGLKEGDWLDLSGDKYADPGDNDPYLGDLYAVVLHAPVQETPECVAVHIDSFDVVGFPTGHEVKRVTWEHSSPDPSVSELEAGDTCICGYKKDKQ